MKNCSYCGREYPDDAIVCAIYGMSLPDFSSKASEVPETSRSQTATTGIPYIVFPEYRWTARDAWKALGMLVVLEFVFQTVILLTGRSFPVFYRMRTSGLGFFFLAALASGLAVFTSAYFARTETFSTFLEAFELRRKPTQNVWFGVVIAVFIQFLSGFLIKNGWHGVSHYDATAFVSGQGPSRYFFLLPSLVLAPIFEEIVNRGFLYKAFRGSLPMEVSTFLLVLWTVVTHWSQFTQSFISPISLTLMTILTCSLRESSNSLWDCIITHFAFNVSLWVFVR
jgi:membrane protease YdiL (CAAX protease family)